MSINTSSSLFRQLDVDQYNEDNFCEDEVDVAPPPASVDEETVVNLLNKGAAAAALQLLLRGAPTANAGHNEAAKDAALVRVLKVLVSINKSNMDEILSTLDPSLLDVLMKYIYRGFERPSDGSSAALLLWHEKVYNVAGVGCIVRVLTDRQRV